MIVLLKIVLITGLAFIYGQDLKDRMVWWFLFPFVGFLMGGIHWLSTSHGMATTYIIINLILMTSILSILWLYTRYISKRKFLNVSFGLGDVLFLYAFAMGFPTLTFLIFFVASVMVALVWSFIKKSKSGIQGIPLAGLMSGFLIIVYSYSLFSQSLTLYIL